MSNVFEEVNKASPKDGKFTATSLEDYVCPRKYLFRKVLRLEGTSVSVDLHFGTSIHAGVATFYAARGMKREEAINKFDPRGSYDIQLSQFKLAKLLAIKQFTEIWDEGQIQGTDKKCLMTGLKIMSEYCEMYEHDTEKFTPELIECSQWLPMSNGTTLGAIIDRVSIQDSYITFTDSKTSGWPLTDYYMKQYDNSFQFSTYYYVIEQLLGQCDAIVVDAIKVPYPKAGKDAFRRKSFLRTKIQIAEWENTYLTKTNRIMDALSKPEDQWTNLFPQEPKCCSDYGGCKYLPICTYGLDHPSVMVDFNIRKD